MTAYTVTFSDGTTKTLKNSRREYTHAWIWRGVSSTGGACSYSGFAGSRELAQQAISSSSSFLTHKPRSRFDAHCGWAPGSVTITEIVEVVRG